MISATLDIQKAKQKIDSRKLAIEAAELVTADYETLSTSHEKISYSVELLKRIKAMLLLKCFRCGSDKWPCNCPEGITLYHGDCRDVLAIMDEQIKFNLLLTDPPYGIEFQSNRSQTIRHKKINGDESLCLAVEAFEKCLERLHDGSHWYCFGSMEPSIIAQQSVLLKTKQILIWNKGNHVGMGDIYGTYKPVTEAIHFGSKGRRYINERLPSVLQFDYERDIKHPTPKPLGLLRKLIGNSTDIGDIVLDPFCGSGSTLVAAKAEGCRAIGIEIDADYCELAASRIAREPVKRVKGL